MKNFIILITIIIGFSSCQKDIKVVIPYEKDQLVLNSLFLADSNLYAQLFISQKLTSAYLANRPANATIALLENNLPVGNFTKTTIYGVEWYKSPIKATAGKEYKLIATAPGLDAAQGADIVPQKATAQLNKIEAINNNNLNSYNRKLRIQITDPLGEQNYYRLKIYAADTNTSANGPRFRFPNGKQPLDLEIQGLTQSATSNLGGRVDNEVFFTDETFEGRIATLVVDFTNYNNSTHFCAELTTLSKATYRYLISLRQQQNSTGDPFAEATTVFSNITGGFGIVGSANERLLFIRKP